MSEVYLDWLKGAEENLEVVNILFKNEKYRFAIFNLQQAAEITSKALLMRVSLLVTSEENQLVKEIREDLHIPAKSAIGYGHDWHHKLMDVMDEFIVKVDKLSEFIVSNNLVERKVISDILEFRDNVPDYKQRIKTAKGVKASLNPSIDELNEVILFCHGRLDLSSKAAQKVKSKMDQFKMPNKKRLVKQTEKAFATKLDSKTLNVVDKLFTLKVSDYTQRIVVFSQTLIILAIINSYLLPHEQKSRYPFGQVDFKYDPYMPLVRRTKDFSGIIRRCIWIGQGRQGPYRENSNLLEFLNGR